MALFNQERLLTEVRNIQLIQGVHANPDTINFSQMLQHIHFRGPLCNYFNRFRKNGFKKRAYYRRNSSGVLTNMLAGRGGRGRILASPQRNFLLSRFPLWWRGRQKWEKMRLFLPVPLNFLLKQNSWSTAIQSLFPKVSDSNREVF